MMRPGARFGFGGTIARWRLRFFVNEDALKRVQSDMRLDEAGLLRAFDLNRERIYAVAAKVYGRGHKGSYDLLLCDF